MPSGEAGVEIVRVLRGSPAEKAGIRVGDVLLQLGESQVDSPAALVELVDRAEPGSEQPVILRRAGQHELYRVALEGSPEFEDRLRLAFVGLPAPSIDGVITFQGEASTLEDLRGRVVLLEFWASWCGICRYLAPTLNRLEHLHRPAGLSVFGITLDSPERGRRAALRTGEMDYSLASDAGGRITRSYLASQVPTVFVIDRAGVVVDVMVGVSEERMEELEGLVEELLASRG